MKSNNDNIDLDFLKLQYQVLSNKQISHNALVWNAPSLLFVAQTFLWNISLNNEISIIIRCLISFVSILIAFASLQNFIRSRWMDVADSEQLVAIEKLMSRKTTDTRGAKANCPAMIVHHIFSERTIITPTGKDGGKLNRILEKNHLFNKHSIGRWRTFYVWKFILEVVILLSTILFIYNLYLAIDSLSKLAP